MLEISYLESRNFPTEFYEDYSKFKHGSKSIAREFGKNLSSVFLRDEVLAQIDNKNLTIYSAPFLNIPTASNALKDYTLTGAAKIFRENNIRIKQGIVHREYSYDDDYGSMSLEQRREAISSDLFSLDISSLRKDDILIFIDDIKITGAHQERMEELIIRNSLENQIIFLYLAKYTGEQPTIEDKLNHFSIKTLKDINDIIKNDEFIFNTRVVKFILKADVEQFVSFITYQSEIFRETLYNLSVLNEYYKNPKYKLNFEILSNL